MTRRLRIAILVAIVALIVLAGIRTFILPANLNELFANSTYPDYSITRYDSTASMLHLTVCDSFVNIGKVDTVSYYVQFKYLVVLVPRKHMVTRLLTRAYGPASNIHALFVDSVQVSITEMKLAVNGWVPVLSGGNPVGGNYWK